MEHRYSKLIVGNSLKVLGVLPPKYTDDVKANLLATFPNCTNITVTTEKHAADIMCGEPYTLLTAEGEDAE